MSNRIYASRMTKNGLAAIFVALIGGFALTFTMTRGISLWPLPVFVDYILPGSEKGWRIFHTGMLMNGIMAVALGAAMQRLEMPANKASLASWGVVIAVWGNCLFYLFGMFAPNHGLSIGTNALGAGNLAGALAFLPAIVGAITLMVAVALMFRSKSQI